MAGEVPAKNYRVSLRNANDFADRITFAVTPDLSESRTVNYKNIDIVHAPGQILAYSNTAARSFNISGIKLVSRTPEEAAINLINLQTLRAWTMPNFGASTISSDERKRREARAVYQQSKNTPVAGRGPSRGPTSGFGIEKRGSPPAVLLLSAYSSDESYGSLGHINRVPVVITNLSIPYPADIDYIPAEGSNVPVPTIMNIDVTLTETHSPNEYETFDLASFKSGTLTGF